MKVFRGFCFVERKTMKYNNIDYSNLNERIVEQAYETAFGHELSKEQLQKLIQDKIERARLYSEQQKKFASYSIA
jgi:hypothetical protein